MIFFLAPWTTQFIIMAQGSWKLAEETNRLEDAYGLWSLIRDAENVWRSVACLLIGSLGESVSELDCGGCGHATAKRWLRTELILGILGGQTNLNYKVRTQRLTLAYGSYLGSWEKRLQEIIGSHLGDRVLRLEEDGASKFRDLSLYEQSQWERLRV